LDADGVITLNWSLDEDGQSVTFHLVAQTLGWVGFGFTPSGGMKGADMIIGWVSDDGQAHFTVRVKIVIQIELLNNGFYDLLLGSPCDW
jgi:hypothetical protein